MFHSDIRRALSRGLIPLLVLAGLAACSDPQSTEPPLADPVVRLGVATQPSNALTHIALAKGYFKQHGLEVEAQDYVSGKRALLNGLLADKADVVSSSDIPVVFNSFHYPDLRILAAINQADNVNRIIARRDRGIAEPTDLRDKRIGTQEKSAVHFFLHLFHLNQGLGDADITMAYFKAENLPPALASGEIDAFSMREPFIGQAAVLLGDNAVIFEAPGLYVQSELLVARSPWLTAHPEHMKRILAALMDAEDFARDHAQEAMGIVAERLNASVESIADIWPSFIFRVTLDQSLLPRLEEMAAWIEQEGYADGGAKPDFLTHIDVEHLGAVRGDRVTIIR